MRMINVAPNAIPHRAANQDIRQVMFLTSEASDADGAGDPVSGNLHHGTIVVFIGNYRCQRPGRDAMSRRKRRSAVKEITAILTGKWTATLRDFFERGYHNRAINQGFSAEQPSLPRAVVMRRAAPEIAGQGNGSG